MKFGRRKLTACLLALAILVAGIIPAALADDRAQEKVKQTGGSEETEGAAAQTESEGLQQMLEEVVLGGYRVSLDLQVEEPMQEQFASWVKGTDFSWAKEASFEGFSCGNEDGGIDASGTLSLNGEELYDGRLSVDWKGGRLYLVCPQFRKTPLVLDRRMLLGQGGLGEETGDGLDGQGKAAGDKPAEKGPVSEAGRLDPARLSGEGGELASSLSGKDFKAFAGRYGALFSKYSDQSQHENVIVTAGALSEKMDTTTVRISQDQMTAFLAEGRESLQKDPLIRKILESDFAQDLADGILAWTKLGKPMGEGGLYRNFQSLLKEGHEKNLEMVPGFTLTYGMDAEGRLALVNFGCLYSGIETSVFSAKMLSRETHTSLQVDLGGLITTYLAGQFGGDPNGQTGLVLDLDTAQGELTDTLQILSAGQEIARADLSGFRLDQARKGQLNGTATLTLGEAVYQADLTSDQAGQVTLNGSYNGTDYLQIQASAQATDHAKVKKINRKKALEVYDQSSWDAYIKDAKLEKMIRKLAVGGVPEDLIDMMTSGEAVTEKSRENTVEKDGTGELENGEVGGADIGHR